MKEVPLRVVVSRFMIVEKGDMVSQAVPPFGYRRMEVEHDGLFIGPDVPIISLDDIEWAVRELKRLKLQRQKEKDMELEAAYARQCERYMNGEK